MRHSRLDAVLAVGFRVRSHRGTQFRRWANERLRESLVKGFTRDDERLKNQGSPVDERTFEELLARIRACEKVFWHKMLDIYATSVDYDPNAQASELFFKTVQNKMHRVAHAHTAAEVIALRADSSQPNRKTTHMADWNAKLDDFLRLSDGNILDLAGKVCPTTRGKHDVSARKSVRPERRSPPPPATGPIYPIGVG